MSDSSLLLRSGESDITGSVTDVAPGGVHRHAGGEGDRPTSYPEPRPRHPRVATNPRPRRGRLGPAGPPGLAVPAVRLPPGPRGLGLDRPAVGLGSGVPPRRTGRAARGRGRG